MDTTTIIDKYTQDLSNLPLEVKHVFEEINTKDHQLMEARKRYQAKDNQIHRFIKHNGTIAKHNKEQLLYSKIEEDMEVVEKLQHEKILLANTALFLISKHLFNFETDITKLERDDLLPVIENLFAGGEGEGGGSSGDMWNGDGSRSLFGPGLGTGGLSSAADEDDSGTTPVPRTGSSIAQLEPGTQLLRKAQRRKAMMKAGIRPHKRRKSHLDDDDDDGSLSESISSRPDGPPGDDADNSLYCFCQRVSFGEMIACDNDDCKFEWFHWSCVGINSSPKDDEVWYCPDCSTRMDKRRKKKRI